MCVVYVIDVYIMPSTESRQVFRGYFRSGSFRRPFCGHEVRTALTMRLGTVRAG
jgi:hypothetical protein